VGTARRFGVAESVDLEQLKRGVEEPQVRSPHDETGDPTEFDHVGQVAQSVRCRDSRSELES
jgi:hypothetical protein